METIRRLEELGFTLDLDTDGATVLFAHSGPDRPDPDRVRGLLADLRQHKAAAVAFLRARSSNVSMGAAGLNSGPGSHPATSGPRVCACGADLEGQPWQRGEGYAHGRYYCPACSPAVWGPLPDEHNLEVHHVLDGDDSR